MKAPIRARRLPGHSLRRGMAVAAIASTLGLSALPAAEAVPTPHHVAVGGGTLQFSNQRLEIRGSTVFGGDGTLKVDAREFALSCMQVVQTESGTDQLHASGWRYRDLGGRPESVYVVIRDGLLADEARVDIFPVESAPCGADGFLQPVNGRFVIAP